MTTNKEISGKFKSTTRGNVDWYYGGGNIAWSSRSAALTGVPTAIRSGKTVGIIENNKIIEYIWHPDNVTDNGLVIKSIQFEDLSTGTLASTNNIPVYNHNNEPFRTTISDLATFINSLSGVAFRGDIQISDTPSNDGWYFASESGTYTNAGNLVVNLNNRISIIIITSTQTVFNQIVIPVSFPIETTFNDTDNANAGSMDAISDYFGRNTTLTTNNKTSHTAAINELKTKNEEAKVSDNRKIIQNYQNLGSGTFTHSATSGPQEIIILSSIIKHSIINRTSSSAIYKIVFFKYIVSTGTFELQIGRSTDGGTTFPVFISITTTQSSNRIFTISGTQNDEIYNFVIDTLDLTRYANEFGSGVFTYLVSPYPSEGNLIFDNSEITDNVTIFENDVNAQNFAINNLKRAVNKSDAANFLDVTVLSNRQYIEDYENLGAGAFSHGGTDGSEEGYILDSIRYMKIKNYDFTSSTRYKISFFRYITSTNTFEFQIQKSTNSGSSYSTVTSSTINPVSGIVNHTENFVGNGNTESVTVTFDLNTIISLPGDFTYFVGTVASEGNLLLSRNVAELSSVNTSLINSINQSITNNSSFINRRMATVINQFPDALNNASIFENKLLELNSDIEIGVLGDSIMAKADSATAFSSSVIRNLPPACTHASTFHNLWDSVVKNKPIYDRWDSTGNTFTEVGTWTDSDTKWDSPSWTGESRAGGSWTRQSNSTNASFSFTWNLDSFEKLNLIHRKSIDGVQTVTVSSGSNGLVEVFNGTSWVEVNNYTFSQYIDPTVATDGSGYTQHMGNVKLKLRKASGASGNVTLTFTKPSNSEFLYFWGTERWNRNTIFFTQLARGGKPTFIMQRNMLNDIGERDLDFIIYQIPLVNDVDQYHQNYNNLINILTDYIWDSSNGRSLRALSRNNNQDWQKFQILPILPHSRSTYFNNDTPLLYPNNTGSDTPYRAYQRVKKLIRDRGGLSYIDMNSVMLNEAIARGWTYQQAFAASTPTTSDNSFTSDGVHINDLGSLVYSRYLAPIFDVTTI